MLEATLNEGEFHPAAHIAKEYVAAHLTPMNREAIASTALSGNRLADLANSTINRIDNTQPISDRYLMGLAWLLYTLENKI